MARLIGNIDATGSLSTSVPAPATNASAVSLYLPFDTDVNDDGPNSVTVTNNGVTISSAQAKFGGYSALFDGTNDYLSIPSDSSFVFGDQNFTIEFFIYLNSNGFYFPLSHRDSSAGAGDYNLIVNRTVAGQIEWFNGNYSVSSPVVSATISGGFSGAFHHIAITRSGNTHRIFFDGQLKASASNSSTYGSGPTELNIGRDNYVGGRYYLDGYLDDLRITKGIALYTQNFVPPSQAVGASLSGENETNSTTGFTSLYLPFDSSVTADGSPINHSITANGGVNISSTQAKFGSYSAAFDGSDDQLTFTYDTGQYFGTGDFTVELFAYINGYSSGYFPMIFLGYPGAFGGTAASFGMGFENSGGKLRSNVGGAYIDHNNVSISTGQWLHIVGCRQNGVYRTFVNGELNGSTANTNNIAAGSGDSSIGAARFGGGSGTFYGANGFIDDVRVLNGLAKYTAPFTPPTSAVTATVSQTRNDLAVLYLPFDDGLEDKARNHPVTANGNAAVSATQAKFGGKSLALDGTGDYLTIASGSELQNFNSEPFTIEGFFYCTEDTTSTYQIIMSTGTGSSNWRIVLQPSTKLFEFYDGAAYGTNGSWTVNTWHHFAVCGDGTNVRQFIDGVQIRSDANTNVTAANTNITFGVHPGGSSNYFTGFLDDITIIKGFAKYTGAFTPPTAASGGEVLGTTTDTRTFSSVWNLNSPEVTEAFKAGTWPINVDTQYTLFYASFDTNANDESAAGLTATLSGNANIQSSTAKFGSALDVDGSGDFVTYSGGVALGATDFTIEHWLYLNTTSSGNEVLVANYLNSSVKGWMWRLFGNNANSLGFSYNDGAWRHFYVNSSIITNNQWHHVACVYDQSAHSMAIYLDGVAQTVTTSNVGSEIGASARDTNVLTISKLDGYTQEFDGQMDDLMILNTKRYTANFTPPTAASGGGV